MNPMIDISGIKERKDSDNGNNNPLKSALYKTKIKKYEFLSINEANIGEIIKTTPYYTNNYAIVEEYEFVNINQIDGKYSEKINNNNRYLLFKYKNDSYVNYSLNMGVDSLIYLLNSLIQLNDHNICFFNISPENIVINLDCGEKAIIVNFEQSLQLLKLNESYITNIIKTPNNYTYKPLEVHVLFYLIQNNLYSISYAFIEEICEKFVKECTWVNKDLCIESLQKYINKSKTYIINDILRYYDKWDVYSISLLYLNTFTNPYIQTELLKNIHPDPSKRNTLKELLTKIDTMNWSKIN
jgi:hypothetical protein